MLFAADRAPQAEIRMRKMLKVGLYLAAPVVLGVFTMSAPGISISLADRAPPQVGAYDPLAALDSVDGLRLDHIFISWKDDNTTLLRRADRAASVRGRELLVTVEPFLADGESRETMFRDIRRGVYDSRIKAVCRVMGSSPSAPLVRWGHEMDDRSGRYPWAQPDAKGYISAYRYFVDMCRQFAPAARFVWSPMGTPYLEDYYPGPAHVDYVGLPVWGFQAWDMYYFGRTRTLNELIGEKYSLVKRYKKPVIIAEFGVAGEPTYQRSLLSKMRSTSNRFPRLRAIVYFNMKEPYFWPNGFGSPDWRVPARMLARFIPSDSLAAAGE